MALSIAVIPDSPTIDICGELATTSAYSLSGHVSVSLQSSFSLFDRRRTARLLLQSLVITFEGQSELVTPETGYSAVRLCSLQQELVPDEPVELSNEGFEDSTQPCAWNVVFNLRLPGWLPASDVFGDRQMAPAGTRYALYATARYQHIQEPSQTSPWISTLCAPIMQRTRIAKAPKCNIVLNRFTIPPLVPHSEQSIYPLVGYIVSTLSQKSSESGASIPSNILSKIQILASIPEHIGTEQDCAKLTLRLRAPLLSDEETEKINLSTFTVDIDQREVYHMSLPSHYNRLPIPNEEHQPPRKALLDPHPMSGLSEVGLLVTPQVCHSSVARNFSLLAGGSTQFEISTANDGQMFSRRVLPDPNAWYTMQMKLPLVQESDHPTSESRWAGPCHLRPSSRGPFLTVKHSLKVTVQCQFDTGDGHIDNLLEFSIPLDFVRERLPLSQPMISQSQTLTGVPSSSTPSPTMPTSSLYGALPAYSELYHSNGDRKYDESVSLPLYTASP